METKNKNKPATAASEPTDPFEQAELLKTTKIDLKTANPDALAAEIAAKAPPRTEPKTPHDRESDVMAHVITDLRAMFVHNDPAAMSIVEDLRNPQGRGVFADSEKAALLTEALDMRAQLHNRGIDPHAVAKDATEQERTAANDYIEHLRKLRNARHAALTGS